MTKYNKSKWYHDSEGFYLVVSFFCSPLCRFPIWLIFFRWVVQLPTSHDAQGFQTCFFSPRVWCFFFLPKAVLSWNALHLDVHVTDQARLTCPWPLCYSMARERGSNWHSSWGKIYSHTVWMDGWMIFFCFWGGPEVLLIVMIVMVVETLANHLECMKHVPVHILSLVLPTWLFHFCQSWL